MLHVLLSSEVISTINILIPIGSIIVSIIGGYIIIRERILKTELKLTSMTDYIDRKNEIIENKIGELQADILEFKQLNKEMGKALAENTAAIHELRTVLDLLKEQLGVMGQKRIRGSSESDI